ncbi:MAG: c-type cytochrome [Acidobacteriota bacterium]|nr:c-type cytochrome [Acidobacteriota bacterium]
MRTDLLKLLLGCAAVLALSAVSPAQVTQFDQEQQLGVESHIGNLTGHANKAKENYRRYCLGCHGVAGDGEGENAAWLEPKPRNFTLAQFKCRSTPTGTLPTDEDLYNTVGRGITNSNMPAWFPLPAQERADLVAYVKHFSPKWKTEKPGAPIEVPAEPQVTPERIKAGQALFQKLECWKCHGVEGRANGVSADTLTDDQNRPIKPFNFHDSARFKCGTTNHDLYKIFMTGLDGTPMPSFADNVKPDEAWDLVFYLRTLQPMPSKEKQIAKQLGLKPINPNAAAATAPQAEAPAAQPAAPATPAAQPDATAPAAQPSEPATQPATPDGAAPKPETK